MGVCPCFLGGGKRRDSAAKKWPTDIWFNVDCIFFSLILYFLFDFHTFPSQFWKQSFNFFFSNLAHVFLITICFCQNNLLNYNLFSISSSLDFFHLSYLILILLITIWFIWDNFFFMISFSFIFLRIRFDLHSFDFFFTLKSF